MTFKKALVYSLYWSCDRMHWFFHRRPWMWLDKLPPWWRFDLCTWCPLADIGFRLEERWELTL